VPTVHLEVVGGATEQMSRGLPGGALSGEMHA
jgi:hypothetical protein